MPPYPYLMHPSATISPTPPLRSHFSVAFFSLTVWSVCCCASTSAFVLRLPTATPCAKLDTKPLSIHLPFRHATLAAKVGDFVCMTPFP
ncbi:hypothetical protein Naga_101682g2 [Nannochloropsis gaditana]|uniref:Uncharacterized protein n=1 Tax=Nannochloropsis gaditana TaxID=72520 RepID=W7TF03_9STRA|nr:hypothetical protein Naga_101682g2 [Nannochloropsis gaditana]